MVGSGTAFSAFVPSGRAKSAATGSSAHHQSGLRMQGSKECTREQALQPTTWAYFTACAADAELLRAAKDTGSAGWPRNVRYDCKNRSYPAKNGIDAAVPKVGKDNH